MKTLQALLSLFLVVVMLGRAEAGTPASGKDLSRAQRLAFAKKVLGVRSLTRAQGNAIMAAHHVGEGELGKDGKAAQLSVKDGKLTGNYTFKQLRTKINFLVKSKQFTAKQADKLARRGVTGWGAALSALAELGDTLNAEHRLLDGEDRGNLLQTIGDMESLSGNHKDGARTRATGDYLRGDFRDGNRETVGSWGMDNDR
jgi:hypothetical protein